MVRGPVRINTYDQRSQARSQSTPFMRAPDLGDGIAPGLNALAGAARDMAQADQQIEQLRLSREEDDARVYVSSAMARLRADATAMQREVFQTAPDGFRDATPTISARFGELREQALAGARTPSAQRFMSAAIDSWQPLFLDDAAAAEQAARSQYNLDTLRSAFQTNSALIASDPRLYSSIRAQDREIVNTMAGFDANERRDILQDMESEYATVAVSALIERDPAGALSMLRSASGGGAADPNQIASLIGGDITSTQRTPERNAQVGGVPNSMHLTGEAADITVPARYAGMSREAIEADVRQRLTAAGVSASEIIYEGDHIHIGWRGVAGAGEASEPDPNSPVAALTGAQRITLTRQAEAELERRASQTRTQVRDQVDAARGLWRVGEQAPNAPTVDAVRAALGDQAAAAYETDMQVASLSSEMQSVPSAELMAIRSAPPLASGTERERLDNAVRRAAAAGILEQRADPMAYLQRRGQIDTQGFNEAMQEGQFATLGYQMRQRVAIMQENAPMFGGMAPILSTAEASALRSRIDSIPTVQGRQQAIADIRGAMSNNPAAYRDVVGMLYRDAPGAQLAMLLPQGRQAALEGAPNVTTEQAQRRLLEGAAALGMVQGANQPGQDGADRPRQTFAMPSDTDLRRTWASQVGDAYRGMPMSEAAAFEAYRAAYAGAAIEAGDTSGVFDNGRAREAVAIATGGIARSGDRQTLLPWGMNEQAFETVVARGWDNIQGRYNGDLRERPWHHFEYMAVGGGRYAVMRRGAPALDSEGNRIFIQIPGR